MQEILSRQTAKFSGNVLILFTHHPDSGRKAQSRRYDFICELPSELKDLQPGTAFEVNMLFYMPHSKDKAPIICYDKDETDSPPKSREDFLPPGEKESNYDHMVFLSLKGAEHVRKHDLLDAEQQKKPSNIPVKVSKAFFDHLLEGLVYAPAGLGLHQGDRRYKPRENSTLAVIGGKMIIEERFPCCFCKRMIQRHGFYVRRVIQEPEGRLQLPAQCYFFDDNSKNLIIPYAVPRSACKEGRDKEHKPVICPEAERRECRTLTSAIIPDGLFVLYEPYHVSLLEKINLCAEGKLDPKEAQKLIRDLGLDEDESESLLKKFMTFKLLCHRGFIFGEHKPVAYDKFNLEYAAKHGLKTSPDTPDFWSAAVLSADAGAYFSSLSLITDTNTEVFWGRKGVALIFRQREQFRAPAMESLRSFYEFAYDST